jgi:hypothetical protein
VLRIGKAGGVSDGVRTRDRWSHNPELYQLSYAHLIKQSQIIARYGEVRHEFRRKISRIFSFETAYLKLQTSRRLEYAIAKMGAF